MKKITLLLFCFLSFAGFAQSKSTGLIDLDSGFTANFTLNNDAFPPDVTLVLTGPTDRWFALGFGSAVVSGFRMSAGDVVVYNGSVSDRFYLGTQAPGIDNLDWTTVSNVSGSVRTLTLKRALTTTETSNDLQMPYASTNSINIAYARNADPGNSLSSNHSVGFATGSFTTLGVEDFSLNATSVYPNPSSGEFYIKTKTNLSKVNLYSQTGALVKTLDVADDSKEVEVNISGIQSGVYFLELLNNSEKSWKKVIVN